MSRRGAWGGYPKIFKIGAMLFMDGPLKGREGASNFWETFKAYLGRQGEGG